LPQPVSESLDCNGLTLEDVETLRTRLPVMGQYPLNLSAFISVFKNLVGKDLSKFSLPVFLNEPVTITQKTAEMVMMAD